MPPTKTIVAIGAVALIAVVAYGLYKKSQTVVVQPANPNSAVHQNQGQDNSIAGTLTSGAVALGTAGLDSFKDWIQG